METVPITGKTLAFEDYKRNMIMNHLGQAVIGQADLLVNVEDKLKLFDWYLGLPQVVGLGFMDMYLERILRKKAELSGDPSINNDYYDVQIKSAATDGQRVAWYVRKVEGAPGTDQPAIEEEMIAKFSDNRDK